MLYRKKNEMRKDFSEQVVKKSLGRSEFKQRPKRNEEPRKDLRKGISKLSKHHSTVPNLEKRLFYLILRENSSIIGDLGQKA